ncbi:hypothetical protein HBI58_150720 [Parastagonospora nodorum]|nr:hypothetical protein HBI58_150720 [Parastagonospora nodorum]
MSQTNVREGYRITTLEVVKLIEDLISYLAVAKCTQLRNAQIPKVFYEAAYGAKVKTEDLSNTLTLTLSETAQRRSLSVVSNRSTALITDKFSIASLTKLAILNDANVALVDAVHHSVQKLEENYFEVRAQHLKYDALIQHLSLPKPPLKRCKTEAADSRHAKASGGRTKKDKDLEDSDTGSDRLGKEAQLKKTRDEEELAKLDGPLDSDDYCLDSSSDIDSKDNLEDEEATTAKDLLTDAYILYFKELLFNNGGIFANAIGIGKMRAMVLATEVQNARAEGDATEHNAVNDNDKLCLTEGKRTFYCACERSPFFNAEPRQAATMMTTLQFCFFSNSPLENMGRLTKEEAMEMRIDTTDAISKALAAANKLVASQSYIIPEANTPAVHSKATKHRLAPSAAQFVIVCGFGKVDKHVFRAYNTISVTAQRTIIRKGSSYVEKRAILLSGHVTALSGTPIEQGLNKILIFVSLALISLQNRKGRNIIANVKHDASKHESSHEYKELISQGAAVAQRFILKRTLKTRDLDILEKEGLNKLEASRRVIFNCFKMQAIFKTYSSCKVKRFTLNSVKDLFTNLSKDYFLVREARAITKSSLNRTWSIAAEDAAKAANTPPLLKEVRAKILIESYKLIVQALAEMCVGIVYFNLDSELELKVLGKQDVKTTS